MERAKQYEEIGAFRKRTEVQSYSETTGPSVVEKKKKRTESSRNPVSFSEKEIRALVKSFSRFGQCSSEKDFAIFVEDAEFQSKDPAAVKALLDEFASVIKKSAESSKDKTKNVLVI